MAEATPIQLLRSEVLNKRPDPTKLLKGQPAVNINPSQPGLFFADSSGTSLFKVGPCSVGTEAPNTGATEPGALGNTLGEMWLDTAVSEAQPLPVLKIWNGTSWVACVPFTFARPVISGTAPALNSVPDGTQWWNSENGLMYIAYNDGNSKQWVQVGASPAS
jgi:hypothetical protein